MVTETEAKRRLSEHVTGRVLELTRLKGEGRKVIGYMPGDYVPEEIIYAAGGIPVCLAYGGEREPVDACLKAGHRFLCPLAKSVFGYKDIGVQPYYELTDMLIGLVSCQNLRRSIDFWNFYYPEVPTFRLGVPYDAEDEEDIDYFRDSLEEMKEKLERFTGNTVTDEKLREAIELYNRMRGLLREISLLRISDKPPITCLEFVQLNHASLVADPVVMVECLESLLEELKGKQGNTVGPRLVLSGPALAIGDYMVLELLEESGASIVVEDICEGIRYYWRDIKADGDLLDNLACGYTVGRHPCAFGQDVLNKRFDFIQDLVTTFNAKGIVWYQLKYCETYDIESYHHLMKARALEIPFLKLESDFDPGERGALRTRIEAFVEAFHR